MSELKRERRSGSEVWSRVAIVISVTVLCGGVAVAQQTGPTCGVPGSSVALPAPCTDSWVAPSGFASGPTGQASSGPTTASTTNALGANASANTSFNLNQLSLTSTSGSSAGPVGESRFLDEFMVTGGTGTATVKFYWSATGALQQFAPPTNCDPFRDGVDYGLGAVSGSSAASLAWQFLSLCTADTRVVNRTGSFAVTVTYGVPFVEGLVLSGDAPNGLVNVTTRFTAIELPTGATLSAASHTVYPTVQLSPTVLLTSVLAYVESLNLSNGIANSLDAKLQNALQALDAAHAGDVVSACNRIAAFTNEVDAETGTKLTTAQAGQLQLLADNVQTALQCR